MESNVNNEQTESVSTNLSNIQQNSEIKTKFELTIESIKKELEQLKNIKSIQTQFIPFNQTKYLIKIYYLQSKEYNPLSQMIIFYIEISDKYPEAEPKLTCHSNFCSPSLYDSRNLIKEILSYSKQGHFKFFTIITRDIPEFVRKCLDNMKNKIYNFFGEYKLNRLYIINDFFLNTNNHIYRVKNKKKENVYLVTTDVALLVIQQYKKEEKGKLLSYNELRHFDNFEIICQSKEGVKVSVIVHWSNQKKKTDEEEVYHLSGEVFKMLEKDIEKKKIQIISQFTQFKEKKPENVVSDTLNLIKKKEEEYNNNKDNDKKEEMISDLIYLYQQGIELLNEKGDSRYMEYIQRFKNLVQHQKL